MQKWRERVRGLSLRTKTLAIATGTKERTTRSYIEGTRNPSDEWIAAVTRVMDCIERGGTDDVGDPRTSPQADASEG